MTAVPAPKSSRGPRSRRKVWTFRLLSMTLGLLFVAVLELALRLSGYGREYNLVISAAGNPARLMWQLNPEIDRVYFGSREMLGPEPRRFDMPKPANVYRIVVLGESTVNGFPYATEIAFPRQMEAVLESQWPETDVEVLNAGITAINGFEIADLAKYCADCAPDLVIIHAGHNEFFGPGGPGSSVLPLPPALVRATFVLRRTRLGQLLGALVPSSPPKELHPLQELPRLTEVRITNPEYKAATDNFRQNITSAVGTLRAAGLPVLLTTVACNLKDQAPIRSLWPTKMTEAERAASEETLQAAEEHLRNGQAVDAIDALQSLPELAREAAGWQYRYAQALEAQGDRAAAFAAYSLARDYDGCRFRAASELGEIVRTIAADRTGDKVWLLDLESIVNANAAGAAPGSELFLEHVHYNLAGHRLLARELAQAVCTQVRQLPWDAAGNPADSDLDTRLGILPEDDLAAASFALQAVQTSPFAEAVDAESAAQRLTNLIERKYQALPAERSQVFADLTLRDMQHDLAGALARGHAQKQQAELSLQFARANSVRRFWDAEAWILRAQAEALNSQAAAAAEAVRAALELSPENDDARRLSRLFSDP